MTPVPDYEVARLVKWNDKVDQAVRINLKALLQDMVIVPLPMQHEDGTISSMTAVSMDQSNVVVMEARIHILAAYVQLQDIELVSQKRMCIEIAAIKMKEQKQEDISAFKRHLAEGVHGHINKPIFDFNHLFVLNIDPVCFTGRTSFNVAGVEMLISSWKSVEENFNLDQLNERILIYNHSATQKHFSTPTVPLICRVQGRDVSETFTRANQAFDLLRSVFNMVESANVFRRHIGRPQPLATFLPPLNYGAFDSSGNLAEHWYNAEPPAEYPRGYLIPQQMQAVDKLLGFFKRPTDKEDIMRAFLDAQEQYQQALDTTDMQKAFLCLWRVLEIITSRPGNSGMFNTENILRRTESLFFKNALFCDLLRVVHDERNRLVHRGQFADEGRIGVAMLKLIVELCLANLSAIYEKCPTWDKLEQFYSLAQKETSVLEQEMTMNEYVQSLRADISS